MRRPAALILLFTSMLFAESPKQYPVHWTSEIKLKSQNDIDRVIAEPVDMSKSGGSLDCGHEPENGKTITCRTCVDYSSWKDAGNEAPNTYQISMESWFKYTCLSLKFLKQAKLSSNSYFQNFVLKKSSVTDLSPLIQKVSMDEETQFRISDQSDEYSVTLKSEDGYDEVSIDQMAWGDFNQDGNEDSLFYLSYHATQGTLRYFTFAIATRESRDGPLKVIEQLD